MSLKFLNKFIGLLRSRVKLIKSTLNFSNRYAGLLRNLSKLYVSLNTRSKSIKSSLKFSEQFVDFSKECKNLLSDDTWQFSTVKTVRKLSKLHIYHNIRSISIKSSLKFSVKFIGLFMSKKIYFQMILDSIQLSKLWVNCPNS